MNLAQEILNKIVEWNVYVAGEYVGCVFASTEQEAREAGISQFPVTDGQSYSVSPR